MTGNIGLTKFGLRKSKFRERVLAIVKKIPKGGSMTYKQVATKAGNMKAARAVGAIMRTNYDPNIPCHRVIRSDRSLGSYNRGGERKKRALLKTEGAIINYRAASCRGILFLRTGGSQRPAGG